MNRCAVLALLVLFCFTQTITAAPREYRGVAARYSPGTMIRVAHNRGIPVENCMIAATHERIGTWVTVTGIRTKKSLTCLVVDVPAPKDRRTIERRNIVVEIQHKHAITLCGSTREPPRMCPVLISRR
jgi:hypothetical protein